LLFFLAAVVEGILRFRAVSSMTDRERKKRPKKKRTNRRSRREAKIM